MKAMNKISIALLALGCAASANAAMKLKMGMQPSVGSIEYESAVVLGDTLKELSGGGDGTGYLS